MLGTPQAPDYQNNNTHEEDLDLLFIIPGVQDDTLPPGTAGGTVPEQVVNGQIVVPDHSGDHINLGGLNLVSTMEISGSVQDAWWAQGAAGFPIQDVQLLALGKKATSHGDQLPHHV